MVARNKEIIKKLFLLAHIARKQITLRDAIGTSQMLSAELVTNKVMLRRCVKIVVPRQKKKQLLLS